MGLGCCVNCVEKVCVKVVVVGYFGVKVCVEEVVLFDSDNLFVGEC